MDANIRAVMRDRLVRHGIRTEHIEDVLDIVAPDVDEYAKAVEELHAAIQYHDRMSGLFSDILAAAERDRTDESVQHVYNMLPIITDAINRMMDAHAKAQELAQRTKARATAVYIGLLNAQKEEV